MTWRKPPLIQSVEGDYAAAELHVFMSGLHQVDPTAKIISTTHDEMQIECAIDKEAAVAEYVFMCSLSARFKLRPQTAGD